MKRAWIALSAFILVTVLLVVAQVVGSNGDGTSGNPYQITNCAELQDMNNNLAAHYVLVNDIDCSDTVNWNSGAGFVPIGDDTNRFAGTLDGQNHTITNLFINRSGESNVGLFGWADSGTNISNVGLEDVSITGNYNVGGLVGKNIFGTISNSYATGNVNGNYFVGGLVGWDGFGTITDSCSSASVSGAGDFAGGLVGYSGFGTITDSYSSASVSANGYYAGGLVGYSAATITHSYSTGSVSGVYNVGGLVGDHVFETITDSYSTGSVSGVNNVGGLVGSNAFGTITNSYSTGSVSGVNNVGGLVGLNEETISNCYWNNHAGNPSVGIGSGPGDCTAINDNESYFYYSSNPPMDVWDFVDVWAIYEGVDYPYLQWQITDTDGDGIPDDEDNCPYEDATGLDADGDGCIDTLTGLQEIIDALPDDVLSDEIKNSLVSKVNNALKSADKEKDEAAINILQAFINQIEAQRGKKISEEVADMLSAYANNIIAQIEAG